MSHYDTLGVPRDASAETIKKAHRDKVKQTHPDAKGGDGEAFRKVQNAYLVLSDAERRKRYDETGEDTQGAFRSPEEQENEEARALLGGLIVSLISDPSISEFELAHTDIRARLVGALNMREREHAKARSDAQRAVARAEKIAKRWKRKAKRKGADAPDIIAAMIASQISDCTRRIEAVERAERITKRVVAMLEGYEYAFEPPSPADVKAQAFAQMRGIDQTMIDPSIFRARWTP